jgi:hypothetical protein
MTSALARARFAGGMLALATFALGVAAGLWLAHRPEPGLNISVLATNAIPRELERLGLTNAQRAPIQAALTRGRDRVLGVTDTFQGRIEAAADTTDQEIRALLSDGQRASFDSARRANGPQFRRKRVIVHR